MLVDRSDPPVKETDWYPKTDDVSRRPAGVTTPYRFPLVEADSTYYRPPGEQLTRGWAEHTPERIHLNVKAYSLFTHIRPNRRRAVARPPRRHQARVRGEAPLYAEHLEPDALDEVWDRFAHALASAAPRPASSAPS